MLFNLDAFFFWFRRVSFLRTLQGVNTFWWCIVPISLSTPTWGAGEYRYLRVGRNTMNIPDLPLDKWRNWPNLGGGHIYLEFRVGVSTGIPTLQELTASTNYPTLFSCNMIGPWVVLLSPSGLEDEFDHGNDLQRRCSSRQLRVWHHFVSKTSQILPKPGKTSLT